jgi:hypothetical protein
MNLHDLPGGAWDSPHGRVPADLAVFDLLSFAWEPLKQF